MQQYAQDVLIEATRVRYYDAGSGDVLVLLHGFCESSEIFELFYEDLSKACRVIAIDLPGHGKSGLIPGMHYLEEVARWINRVLQQIGVREFIFIGHSLGAYIGLAMAEFYPARFRGFGLFHSQAGADLPERYEVRNKVIEVVERHGKEPFLKTFVTSLFYRIHPDLVERLLEIGAEVNTVALIAFTEAMRDRINRRDILRELDVPVLYIAGGYDELIPRSRSREEMKIPRNCIPVFLEESGHAGFYEEPEASKRAILSFLEICNTDEKVKREG